MLYYFSVMKYNAYKQQENHISKGEMIMKKLTAIVLTLTLLIACLPGCAKKDTDSDTAYVRDKGKLIVGITEYAPMDYKDENGQWTGFDAEFARAVAAKLGVEVEFLEIDWDNKVFELNSKAIDCVWNGMTITEEVKRNMSVSSPYVKNAQVVVMNQEFAADYNAIELLQTLDFAVEAGSAGAEALDGLEITDYIQVQTQSAALMEVAAGTVQACVIDITMANAMTGPGTGYPELAIANELSSEEYGIGFRKDSDLTETVNGIMAELMADGTLDVLAEKYSLTLVK